MTKLIKKDLIVKSASPPTTKRKGYQVSSIASGKVHLAPEVGEPGITYWLGMRNSAAKKIQTDFDIIRFSQHQGVFKQAINSLASYIGVSRKNIAEDIFDISVKTLERKDDKARLDKKASSHAVEIARVVQHAYEVFRDEDKVKLWINRENRALNNMKPVELLDTLTGLTMINDILGRIQEGIYS